MGWDYSWSLNSLTLSNVCTAVRVEQEGGSSFLDNGIHIPGRDGVQTDDQAPYGPLEIVLRTVLRYTNSAGAITDGDGAAGHVYDNLSQLKKEFAGPGLATLTRTLPHIGTVRALCKLTAAPQQAERHVFLWPLTVPSGSWQTSTQSSASGNPPSVTTDGDRRVWDPIIEFSAAGTFTLTASDGTQFQIVAASGPTYPVTVDVGAGTVLDNGGSDARGDVTFNDNRWCMMEPGTAQSITTTASCTVKWRDRWA